MRNILLTLGVLLAFSTTAYSQNHMEGHLAGSAFSYNSNDQYVQISVKDLMIPSIQKKTTIEKMFNNRPDYVLCTLKLSMGDHSVHVTPFSLTRTSSKNYDYETFDPGTKYVLFNKLKYPVNEPLVIDITFRAWEGDKNSAWAKTIFAKAQEQARLLDPGVLNYIGIGLDLISSVIPPENSSDKIHANIGWVEITHQEYRVTTNFEGEPKQLMTIEIKPVEAHLEDFNFDAAMELDFLSDSTAWIKAIREAATESMVTDSQQAIRPVLLAFSDYIDSKPFAKKDKALFAAGALHQWVPGSVEGCLGDGCISAGLYQEMSVGELYYLRGGNKCWDFGGVDCSGKACIEFNDFLRKSGTETGRGIAQKYINDEFSLYLDGNLLGDIPRSKYLKDFAIKNVPNFKVTPDGARLKYILKGNAEIRYKKDGDDRFTIYNNHDVEIIQYYADKIHYIDKVELKTKK
ncbi:MULTISPECIES: hypothetical protein [unclassified Pseudodesulfovibrio]|uniref:hypothetical protein n=1 Tax=unclassified Pseudodesulfovibrio TaxID=2661612 RepID=UPI000FEB9D37|nr:MULTISPECIES: hypothetical protein [unclassified Pseudodesulfovibrio]MCJ2163567.1 hypothetical protein [Pseudodesulfovibrio sp. S3-i]RWU06803.1 hypothetical protein DWB63_03295 [Pseudodesulfovibrio sp. S3]